MASFNQNPLGQASIEVGIGTTSPIGIGTINPDAITDTFQTFSVDIAGTTIVSIPSSAGGDTRPTVGLVYPR